MPADSKDNSVLYVHLQKTLYSLLKSSLHFHKKLLTDPEKIGFTPYLYDPCVTNKMVNGFQMMVVWHMDDVKILHTNDDDITQVKNYLKSIDGNINSVAWGGA